MRDRLARPIRLVRERLARLRAEIRSWPRRLRAWARTPAGRKRLAVAGLVGALAILATFLAFDARATLRAVNATEEPVRVTIDENTTFWVPSASVETPNAGVTFRLFPGSHELVTYAANGEKRGSMIARVGSYARYLAVVATDDECFAIERVAYGRAKRQGPARSPIPRGPRVVTLPDDVDAWFSPNPEPNEADRYSSGGERVAVRQERCRDDEPATEPR